MKSGWLVARALTISVSTAILTAPASPSAPAPSTFTATNPLPPRVQWSANDGYCGEVSFISAGLYYGQYLSQYDARALAGDNARQNLPSSQLLLGVNDVSAAKAMHLNAAPFDTAHQGSTESFLTWVKSNVLAGHPVIIGVLMNQYRFYGDTHAGAGDADYDHIVMVTGVSSTHPLAGPTTYYSDDILTFNDNGLWTGADPQTTFSYPFGSFTATRQQANSRTGPVYSLNSDRRNYGIAITGVNDQNRETLPVRLTTSADAEIPGITDNSTTRPPATPVTLTITVSGLNPGSRYTVYRYAGMAEVPDAGFNASAANADQEWTFTASYATHTLTRTVMSNEIAAYRAVPVGAP